MENPENPEKTNKFTKKNALIVLFIITLIIVFPMIWFYCYYYFYSIPKRRKHDVKTRMRVLTELYRLVVDIANENNVKPFLLYGSLLGQQRNNKLICYDFDVDLGILSTDFNKLYTALKKEINTDKYSITLIDNFFLGKHIHIKDIKTSLNIDIDLFVKQQNGSFKRDLNYLYFLYTKSILNQCNKRDIPYDWLLPLRPVSFLKKNVYIPNNPSAFLECEYGKQYSTPDHKCNNDCTKCVQK